MKKKRWRYRSYRSPRTTQERRLNGSRKDRDQSESNYKWSRKKRCRHNLPNMYDDIPYAHQRSWKKRRKTQYRQGGERRVKHEEHFWFYRGSKKDGSWKYDALEMQRYRRVFDEVRQLGVYYKSETVKTEKGRGYKLTWYE